MIMDAPEIPLVWPDDFPPTDPVKKFFYGIRWLGPDISFFKRLKKEQGLRNEKLLSTWTDPKEQRVAQLFGECLSKALGWKTPFFMPSDKAVVVAYGPKFQDFDDLGFEEATIDFEHRVEKQFCNEFWERVVDWNDRNVTFGELTRKLADEVDGAPTRDGSDRKSPLGRLFRRLWGVPAAGEKLAP
jgi:hypothetical protein